MIVFNVLLSGNTYMLREEIKALVPPSKTFTNKWRWIKSTKSWQLKMADTFLTDEFKTLLKGFAKQYDLALQINEVAISSTPKSINDYASEEEYWEAFHKRNGRRYF